MRDCGCCSDRLDHTRREEIRRGGRMEEELPYKKKAIPRSKKFPKHKHDWELLNVYRWHWNDYESWHVKCLICGKTAWWED